MPISTEYEQHDALGLADLVRRGELSALGCAALGGRLQRRLRSGGGDQLAPVPAPVPVGAGLREGTGVVSAS